MSAVKCILKDTISYGCLFEDSKKLYKLTNFQNRDRVTDTENRLMVSKEERRGGINKKLEINIYILLHKKQINSKGPHIAQGTIFNIL